MAAWEIAHTGSCYLEIVTWEVALGKMPLGKYLTPNLLEAFIGDLNTVLNTVNFNTVKYYPRIGKLKKNLDILFGFYISKCFFNENYMLQNKVVYNK